MQEIYYIVMMSVSVVKLGYDIIKDIRNKHKK